MSRMSINYTVLTDHSYSLRIDQEKISLKQQRDMKRKKPRRVTRRKRRFCFFHLIIFYFVEKKTNRTVSIDRSSSDKENNSSISLNKRKVRFLLIGSCANHFYCRIRRRRTRSNLMQSMEFHLFPLKNVLNYVVLNHFQVPWLQSQILSNDELNHR